MIGKRQLEQAVTGAAADIPAGAGESAWTAPGEQELLQHFSEMGLELAAGG